jgi:hypothetical protein
MTTTATEPVTFAVGDGATLHYWTDAHAYTVTAVSASGKTITMQQDTAERDPSWKPETIPGGFAGHTVNNRDQRWTYKPDPDGRVIQARLTARGWMYGGQRGQRVTKGRHQFHDYNF